MPASHRSGFHLHAVVPVSILCASLATYATWHQHDLKIDSPLFATKAQADQWGERTERERHCLMQSVDYHVQGQGFEPVTGSAGPWFGTLRCNQTPRIYWRLGGIFLLSYLTITLVARIFFPPEKKPKG